ncbi:response regulator transcription factor [Desulfonatronum parangueonense]
MNADHLFLLREMTVLLAEDDAQARASLARTLRMFFRQVLEAGDGSQALALFEAQTIHLAILDITMPGPSGLEVAALIRETDPDLPVLILTGHAEPALMRQAVQLRLMDYLIKPVELDALQEALIQCVKEMRNRDRLEVRLAGGVVLNPATGIALVQGHPVQLTAKERQFLNYLARRRGSFVEPYRICLEMSPGEEFSLEALRNLVSRLRAKIGHEVVHCTRDLGYMMPQADEESA